MDMKRREFLKTGLGGLATIVIGSRLGWLENTAYAAGTQVLQVTITDILKGMVTDNPSNPAKCYFWIYKMTAGGVDIPAECPGPVIVATAGDIIRLTITNALDEPHSFVIDGIFNSGPIIPGRTVTRSFRVRTAGAYLYYDNLNSPVNRVMGLHGALIVMPAKAVARHRFTPYTKPTPHVQELYDSFGSSTYFPGLAWEQGDPTPWSIDPTKVNCPPFRQYIWLTHQASSKLFAEVGSLPAGQIYNAQQFMDNFLRAPFKVNNSAVSADLSYTPEYFTINGQSGFFSHFNPSVIPIGRVGEPVVVHALNAGLWTHSMHIHANHCYVTSINGVVQTNPIWIDTFTLRPMDRWDYTMPFMRTPDVPNARGLGRPDTPLPTLNDGHPVWPPIEEFQVFMPPLGTTAKAADGITDVELGQRQSPLCFPMHDHTEPSQTSQGGNYNCGLIAGMYFTGDRNTPGQRDFPMDEDFQMAYQNIRGIAATGLAAPPLGA